MYNKKREAIWSTAILRNLEEKYNGKFDEKTFDKIVFYFSLEVPAIYDAFLSVYKRRANQEEKRRLLYYFICSSIFDNFFDNEELTDQQIHQITFDTENFTSTNFNERVAIYCHVKILNFIQDKKKYLSVLQDEYDVQVQSRKQFDENISDAELEEITLKKGGLALLLCSFYLDNETTPAEYDTWYKLGNVIQLVNDLFDIYKDLKNGQHTLPNRMSDINNFNQFYLKKVQSLKVSINLIPSSNFSKLTLKVSLMGIAALGIIAINQLRKIQRSNNFLPNLNTLSRKDLIVDMENKSNLWAWIKNVYSLSKK